MKESTNALNFINVEDEVFLKVRIQAFDDLAWSINYLEVILWTENTWSYRPAEVSSIFKIEETCSQGNFDFDCVNFL